MSKQHVRMDRVEGSFPPMKIVRIPLLRMRIIHDHNKYNRQRLFLFEFGKYPGAGNGGWTAYVAFNCHRGRPQTLTPADVPRKLQLGFTNDQDNIPFVCM